MLRRKFIDRRRILFLDHGDCTLKWGTAILKLAFQYVYLKVILIKFYFKGMFGRCCCITDQGMFFDPERKDFDAESLLYYYLVLFYCVGKCDLDCRVHLLARWNACKRWIKFSSRDRQMLDDIVQGNRENVLGTSNKVSDILMSFDLYGLEYVRWTQSTCDALLNVGRILPGLFQLNIGNG
jgi:tRNA isopentenyl-2-thiomethyl-A-37 hydroxylase MiaE